MKYIKTLRLFVCITPMLLALNANALVLQMDGLLQDINVGGDPTIADMQVGQFNFSFTTAGEVIIDLTTDGEYDSYIYLFDMNSPTPVLVAENDDEIFTVTDSYLALDLAPGDYMVAVGTKLTLAYEALQGYMIDLPFAYNRNWTSTATYGEWGLTVITPDAVVVPVPAAVWLFGSALLGLVSIGRKR